MRDFDPKVILLFILIVFCHLWFNQSLQLHYDEAYYWVWSKNLQLSYFDHPPMIAYLIRLTTLISDQVFFIRLVGVICGVITLLMIYATTRCLFNRVAANIAVILSLAWPILQGTFFIVTIDSPLLMFWSISIYCLARGLVLNQGRFIYLAGLSIGCALLSKYTAVVLLLAILVFLLFNSQKRKLLYRYPVYLALCLSILVFSPVLIWNYQHDWISFLFQFHHGVALERKLNLLGLVDYIGAMLGAANPFISLPIFVFIWLKRKEILVNERYWFLISIFLVVVLFFAYNSCFSFMEANWVAPAFITGIIFLAECLAQTQQRWIYRSAIILILILLPIVEAPAIFVPRAYQSKIPAINAFMGQAQLYQQIKNNYLQDNDIVLSCDYGNASRGWYYLGVGRTYVLNEFKFSHSYQDWNKQLKLPISHALYYCDDNNPQYVILLQKYFKTVSFQGSIGYHDSFVNNRLYVYRLSN